MSNLNNPDGGPSGDGNGDAQGDDDDDDGELSEDVNDAADDPDKDDNGDDDENKNNANGNAEDENNEGELVPEDDNKGKAKSFQSSQSSQSQTQKTAPASNNIYQKFSSSTFSGGKTPDSPDTSRSPASSAGQGLLKTDPIPEFQIDGTAAGFTAEAAAFAKQPDFPDDPYECAPCGANGTEEDP